MHKEKSKELINKTIVKQDNGKMVIVKKKNVKHNHIPSEWTNKNMSKNDTNAINKKLNKKKKRK